MKMTKVDALRVALSTLTADSYDVQYDTVFADGTPTIYTETYTQQEVREVIEKMIAQLSKPRKTSDEAKARAKAQAKARRADARATLMTQVLPIVRDALTKGGTVKEIYERCADALPADFTVAKVQYILLHEMADEVDKIEQKGKPNTYKMKG